MYFTSLPNHSDPSFDEEKHFNAFKTQNIIFNASVRKSYCEDHVGCLSLKMTFSGEEWYTVNKVRYAVRPGQFLLLNQDQNYSSEITSENDVRSFSIFFQPGFARSIVAEKALTADALLHDPFKDDAGSEFFQKLYSVDASLRQRLFYFICKLEKQGYSSFMADEHLVYLLGYLVKQHRKEIIRSEEVSALKPSTRREVYRRLCIARDVMHSSFMDDLQLDHLSRCSLLSVPQLVRQFKITFGQTPHQYLTGVRLQQAASLLSHSCQPVYEIGYACGLSDASAFCRLFRKTYRVSPLAYRDRN